MPKTSTINRNLKRNVLVAKYAKQRAQLKAAMKKAATDEEFYAAQRAALQRESASITQAVTDQTAFMDTRIEQALAARTGIVRPIPGNTTTSRNSIGAEDSSFNFKAGGRCL